MGSRSLHFVTRGRSSHSTRAYRWPVGCTALMRPHGVPDRRRVSGRELRRQGGRTPHGCAGPGPASAYAPRTSRFISIWHSSIPRTASASRRCSGCRKRGAQIVGATHFIQLLLDTSHAVREVTHQQDLGTAAGRSIASFFIRKRSVLGCNPSFAAALPYSVDPPIARAQHLLDMAAFDHVQRRAALHARPGGVRLLSAS